VHTWKRFYRTLSIRGRKRFHRTLSLRRTNFRACSASGKILTVFRGFCKNWFGIDPLHYHSCCSDLSFVFQNRKSPRIRSQIRNGSNGSVKGTLAEPIYAKTSENPLRCRVPLIWLNIQVMRWNDSYTITWWPKHF
jgi:hypothetical protein